MDAFWGDVEDEEASNANQDEAWAKPIQADTSVELDQSRPTGNSANPWADK